MISRRRILSRSRDELMNGQYPDNYNPYEEEEDVWYSKDKLMKDHILEILNKWEQIDDEIWAKLICMERNRRVAKAYARAPILTINGSDDGFDGYRIGLNGFDNPLRDPKTDSVKHHIGDGVKIRMDDDGNILIKRLAKSNVYVKGWQTDSNGGGQQNQSQNQQQEYQTSVSMEIIRNNGLLELNKAVRLFDMKRFQQNMNRELRRAYPDRRKLENQCICLIGFVKDSPDILDLPVWVMIINIVAMDMLKSKLPPAISKRQSVPNLVSLFDRTKTTIVEEDPYTIPGNNSSSSGSRSSGHYVSTGPMSPPPMNSNGGGGKKSSPNRNNHHHQDPKPPKLPPRDFERNKNKSRLLCSKKSKNNSNSNHSNNNSSSAIKDSEEENNYSILPNNPRAYDDPYYSGFSARVPNFAKKTNGNGNSMMMSNTTNAQLLLPFKSSAYNQHEFLARKVPTSGFLNSYLKSPNVIHSRTASYQSYYGSLGESDPYTVSSEGNGNGTSGEDSSPFIPYGDSPYGAIGRIGMASRYHDPTSKYNGSNYHHQYHSNGKNKSSPPPPAKQLASAMAPYVYRSSRNDDYYCGWDE